MHTGLGLQFANLDRKVSDADVYRLELDLAARAETSGFDSVWMSEHHFADYQLTSQTPMILSWLAGQTKRIKFGTMVTVLPWHDPLRVAEMFSVLDHLSGGRAVLGHRPGPRPEGVRGLPGGHGRVAAPVHRVQRGHPRGPRDRRHGVRRRAVPAAPRRDPTGPVASFRGRTFASAVSPESMEIMARMGVGLMVIAQKPWETAEAELEAYRQRFLELNGIEAPKPILVVVAGAGQGPGRRPTDIRSVYMQRWARSTVEHYEFANEGFADIEGYEYYGALAKNIAKHGVENFAGFLADLQVWGTPDECTEKLLNYAKRTDAGGLVVIPAFGGHAGRRGARPASSCSPPRCSPSCRPTTSVATSA